MFGSWSVQYGFYSFHDLQAHLVLIRTTAFTFLKFNIRIALVYASIWKLKDFYLGLIKRNIQADLSNTKGGHLLVVSWESQNIGPCSCAAQNKILRLLMVRKIFSEYYQKVKLEPIFLNLFEKNIQKRKKEKDSNDLKLGNA